MSSSEQTLRRWRLILGAPADEPLGVQLEPGERVIDGALSALYDSDRKGGLGSWYVPQFMREQSHTLFGTL